MWFKQILRLSLIKDILIIFKKYLLRYCKFKAIERKMKNLKDQKSGCEYNKSLKCLFKKWLKKLYKLNI